MDKKFRKRYLISVIALFLGAFVITLGIVFGVQNSSICTVEMSAGQSILLSLCVALVPPSSFNGFVTIFARTKELSTKKSIALVVLIIPITILAIPLGAIMLIPNIIKLANVQE